jgi:hypothetical protein
VARQQRREIKSRNPHATLAATAATAAELFGDGAALGESKVELPPSERTALQLIRDARVAKATPSAAPTPFWRMKNYFFALFAAAFFFAGSFGRVLPKEP